MKVQYDIASIDLLLRVHKAKGLKRQVEQELDWFAGNYPIPRTMCDNSSQQAVRAFQALIYCRRYDEVLPGYGMAPEGLAKICCQRWLSGDHVSWVLNRLNNDQMGTLCIYLTSVLSVPQFVRRSLPGGRRPSVLMFVINVGRDASTNVFIGNDAQPGAHWTVCNVDAVSKAITYGDSLGWSVPHNLHGVVGDFVAAIFGEDATEYNLVCCHDARKTTDTGHVCGRTCSKLYPLQTCSNVCGVVAVAMSAIACHSPALFACITSQGSGTGVGDVPHLSKPATYSKYLRRVLMVWFAQRRVD